MVRGAAQPAMRQVQIEQHVLDEQARLRRVEAHLRAIEGKTTMQIQDIVIKWTDPIRVAEATAVAPGYGYENLGSVFAQVLPEVLEHLRDVGVRPGISVAYYEAPADDGSVVLHAGSDTSDQDVPENDRVRAVSLPVVEVASVVHRGTMDGIAPAFEALIHWSEDSGFTWTDPTRELYHEWQDEDPSRHVTELQLPIAR